MYDRKKHLKAIMGGVRRYPFATGDAASVEEAAMNVPAMANLAHEQKFREDMYNLDVAKAEASEKAAKGLLAATIAEKEALAEQMALNSGIYEKQADIGMAGLAASAGSTLYGVEPIRKKVIEPGASKIGGLAKTAAKAAASKLFPASTLAAEEALYATGLGTEAAKAGAGAALAGLGSKLGAVFSNVLGPAGIVFAGGALYDYLFGSKPEPWSVYDKLQNPKWPNITGVEYGLGDKEKTRDDYLALQSYWATHGAEGEPWQIPQWNEEWGDVAGYLPSKSDYQRLRSKLFDIGVDEGVPST